MGFELSLGHRHCQGFLVLEVLIDRTGRATNPLCDLFDGGCEVPFSVELEQCADDGLSGALAPRHPPVLRGLHDRRWWL